jgi:hypothetical protein
LITTIDILLAAWSLSVCGVAVGYLFARAIDRRWP